MKTTSQRNSRAITTSLLASSTSRSAWLLVSALIWISLAATAAVAQTSIFTYQGRLTDGGAAASGIYEMQFKLFDGSGNQLGSTITNSAVTVTGGVFTVQLDYGAAVFSGADRLLEIGVRPSGNGEAYTVLSPRQPITSAVYAIRAGTATTADKADNATTSDKATTADSATNATQLGGVAAGQYVQTSDGRLSDARQPTPGSASYIQNSNAQQAADFTISGNGTAGGTLSGGTVNAASQYNIGGSRLLSVSGQDNFFAGLDAGKANTIGSANAFFGHETGSSNTTASNNSFFGTSAGNRTLTGGQNSFFGYAAGYNNMAGEVNTAIGFGSLATSQNGVGNTAIGAQADIPSGLSNATAIGWNAFVSQSNSLVLGSIKNANGADADTNVGIGTTAPVARLHIAVNGGHLMLGNPPCEPGLLGMGFSSSPTKCGGFVGGDDTYTIINRPIGGTLNFTSTGNNGGGVDLRIDSTEATFYRRVALDNLGSGGTTQLCRNSSAQISTCSSIGGFTIKTATNNYGWMHTDGTITIGSYVGGSGDGGYVGTKSNHPLHFFVNDGGPSLTVETTGTVRINTLGAGGNLQLCRNVANQISVCSSSLRYKTNIQPFIGGLATLNRLRPITFDWKQGGMHDLGFGAEDIAAVEPLLVTRNDKGEVEGVKYDRITAVLVNAVKEQQEQINQLKKLVCQRNRRAAVCK